MSSSSGQSPPSVRSPLDSILERAHAITRQAVQEDQRGNFESAIIRYEEAIEVLTLVAQNENREFLLDNVLNQIDAARNRIARLRALSSQPSSNSLSVPQSPPLPPRPSQETSQQLAIQDVNAMPNEETSEVWEQIFSLQGVLCFEMMNPQQPSRQLSSGDLPLVVLERNGTVILQVGDRWRYELLPNIPCLSVAEERYFYVFPGLASEQAYGLMLPRNVDSQSVAVFERILENYCLFPLPSPNQRPPSVEMPSEADEDWEVVEASNDNALALAPEPTKAIVAQRMVIVAEGLTQGGGALSRGIRRTGRVVSSGIIKGGGMLKASLAPAVENVQVPQAVRDTVHTVAQLTPHVVTVSGAVSRSLAGIAGAIATEIGRSVREATASEGESNGPSVWDDPRMKAAAHIGKAGVYAFANVWSALEEAGHLILTGATDTTADVLEHKFGEQVGEVARETIGVGMDAYHTVGNLRVLSPTRLAIGGGKSAVAGYLGLDKNDTLRLPAEERRPLTVAEVEEADLRFSQLRIEPSRDPLVSSSSFSSPVVSDLPDEPASHPINVDEAYLDPASQK